jgi:hypothetical protein
VRRQALEHAEEARREALEEARGAIEGLEGLEGLGDILGGVAELTGEDDPEVAEGAEFLRQLFTGETIRFGDAAAADRAKAGLSLLVRAEEAFHTHRGRYGTLEEIGAALALVGGEFGDLELHEDHADAGGVRYELRLRAEGYEASATPIDDESVSFVTDQSGNIRKISHED